MSVEKTAKRRRIHGVLTVKMSLSHDETGARKLQVRRRADAEGVLQGDPGRQRHGTVVEEVDLQGHLEARRLGAGLLQEPEFSRATRVNPRPGAALLLRVVARF